MKILESTLITILLLVLGFCKTSSQNTIRFNDRDDDFAYCNFENTFKFKTDSFKNDTLTYRFTDGEVGFKNGHYTYKTKTCDSTLFIVFKNAIKNPTIVFKQMVKIHNIPEPSIAINGIELKDQIDKLKLINADKLDGYIDTVDWLQKKIKVISFVVIIIIENGDQASLESKSNIFTKDMIDSFLQLNSMDKIIFKKVLLSRPDGSVRYLGHDVPLIIK